MRAIDDLKSLGYEIALRGDKVAYKYQGITEPDPFLVMPLLQELKARKQEALNYLSGQTKYCSWREMAVPAEECVKPCYIYKGKECKHLISWWETRLKWLKNNPLPPQERQAQPLSDPDAFDPDGALASLLECARRKGISDDQVASIVDDLIKTKFLKAPWGIKIKNSPILGNYWVVSDNAAKKHIPEHEPVFTAEDIWLLAELRQIFGVKAIEVKKHEQQAGS